MIIPGGVGGQSQLPGTGSMLRAAVRTRCVALSPTEWQWGAATTEGLLLYSLDQGLVFDPTDLGQDVTPQAVQVGNPETNQQPFLQLYTPPPASTTPPPRGQNAEIYPKY